MSIKHIFKIWVNTTSISRAFYCNFCSKICTHCISVREAWVTIIKTDFYSFYIFPHQDSTAKESTYLWRSVTIINSFFIMLHASGWRDESVSATLWSYRRIIVPENLCTCRNKEEFILSLASVWKCCRFYTLLHANVSVSLVPANSLCAS